MKNTHVLVTTKSRGVFFGRLISDPSPSEVTIGDCRNVVRWSDEMRGFLGLASSGPSANCRIGPAAPEATLYEITAIVTCTSDAVTAFEKAPWA